MDLIVKVSSSGPRAPLSELLSLPLGLDVWEVKPDNLVLRALKNRKSIVCREWANACRAVTGYGFLRFLRTFASG